MLVLKQKFIYRNDVRVNRTHLFLFGDNMERQGMAGQAKEMRGEPNAFGFATKMGPGMEPSDFFHDDDPISALYVQDEFVRLTDVVQTQFYEALVIPEDGLGSGLARLHITAHSSSRSSIVTGKTG